MNVKALPSVGRKQRPWLMWLHEKLKGKFLRLRATGVKFLARLLLSLARYILTTSNHHLFSPHHRELGSRKCLLDLLDLFWIQAFMVHFNIVGRTQTRKLLVSQLLNKSI